MIEKLRVNEGYMMIRTLILCGIFVSALNFGSRQAQVSRSIGNLRNPDAIRRVLSGEDDIAIASWWGFRETDSTDAMQQAINSKARKVIVPYMGKPWVVEAIKLASNQEIVFEPGVVVVAKENSFKGKRECMFSGFGLTNLTLRGYGATLRMRKNDYRDPSKYAPSGERHIISLSGCANVNILGLRLDSSGGDGILIERQYRDKRDPPCRNVLIRDCICDDNYRQGISVISVEGCRIDNCIFRNTRGTSPAAGIDLEPNGSGDMLVDVVVSNCISEDNNGSGFIASISRLKSSSRDVSVLFVNCYTRNSQDPGLRVRAINEDGPKGLIEFRNCVCEDVTYAGIRAVWNLTSPIKLRFSNCKLRNVARRTIKTPIYVTTKRRQRSGQVQGIEFEDCYLYDNRSRPFLRITGDEYGAGIYDIRGTINVSNPYGAEIDVAKDVEEIPVIVNSFTTKK